MNKLAILCCAGAVMFMTAGCTTSRLAMDYGTSYQLQKYNQILNIEAEKNLQPVYGMNGRAAQSVEQKYQKSFETPGPAITTYQLNVGSPGPGKY